MFPLLYVVLYPYALYDIWEISKENNPPKFGKAEAITIILVGLVGPILAIFIWVSVAPSLFTYYKNEWSFPNIVASEGKKIVRSLENSFQAQGFYPGKIDDLVKGNPLRKRWLSDPWGNPYHYEINESKDGYTLVSLGGDGIKGTADDLTIRDVNLNGKFGKGDD